MVNEDVLKRLNARWQELGKEFGLSPLPPIENRWNQVCISRIPKEMGNANRELLTRIIDKLCREEAISTLDDLQAYDVLRGVETRDVVMCVKRGRYTKAKADQDALDREVERYDPDSPAYEKARRQEEENRRKYYKEYLFPIPSCPRKYSTEIYLPLAFEYYDQIESGEKVTEFRRYTQNWVRRLLSHPLKTVKFQRGYSDYGTGVVRQMVFEIANIELYDSMTGQSCPADNITEGFIPNFIAIDLGKRIS